MIENTSNNLFPHFGERGDHRIIHTLLVTVNGFDGVDGTIGGTGARTTVSQFDLIEAI